MAFSTVEELIQDIRLGKMVILMDDEDRENEGDLVMAAECVRPQDINFMATHGRGLICMPMTRERCEQLALPLMVDRNASGFGTKFTLSIEAREGVTTGISAADRAHTVRTAAARNARAEDIVQPGHIFPLMAEPGGVLNRAGHTEAACDLARLAGFEPTGVICEIMNEDGTMARREDLEAFAAEHDVKMGTIADLIHYQVLNERTVEKLSSGPINTDFGEFLLHAYRDSVAGQLHFALQKGEVNADEPTLARVHLGSTVRDLLQSQPPGSTTGWNMHRSLSVLAEHGGVLVLLANQEKAEDILAELDIARGTKSPLQGDSAQYQNTYFNVGLGSQILRDVGAGKLRLMGAPVKYNAISGFDLEVVEFVSPGDFS
ncbi:MULTISPECIES: bifunctional 3,4-dihydroxy-2-butanone-4-phosphate synthase/GTP cyclohydrolase II [Spongiibacter]|uniref:bifunctional 3,4-dihydroxy-2-butanone-4-phosphate synthase/GTP cyclohydrolase II n=2 Tax=Spongiibacteraceae TaxID=1706375 RepID=UPI0003B66BE0|nr:MULTISPECIES: bifunctional 3,4-dihydroxy-2-butanone-4-phosphate synthase/GTP cyclohydrolase II [Spongiibacter]MAY38780.1 bifunctional 3,4-dihydroxy-2-butanone-4-phosphate synthase/GTP cyclohydrolase II [Spongiibacter sp.]MBI57106.1 bifunctional 3,4-dihydroxy-2-butanone-4-phosphate synthase/GTP cyclohydrolase II [Spongiibacter sp.]MBO6753088.1 bifunctional 3,4-dihydroxy-2-butanone-4-phosphate synthase/GTP cyclohydrolase II [Spongiibacter sp.]MBU72474.1 bifunctional 3,4-dihydroxy-2-butanone-4-|tara:strand:- start:35806 stop:36930 length:1125 start_codon:yes stop_codon:yes gene_type:complete